MRTKIFLSLLLLVPLLAQEQGELKIAVIEGEGARNSIKAKTATQPVVEVRDENDRPVEGAEVTFRLPSGGPGAFFSGFLNYQVARTDAHGRAVAVGMSPNDQEGRFNIRVTASKGAKTGSAVIAQNNTMTGMAATTSRDHSHRTLYIVLGVVAAGAIAGGIAASHSGSSSTLVTKTPVSIAPGPISVGGPH